MSWRDPEMNGFASTPSMGDVLRHCDLIQIGGDPQLLPEVNLKGLTNMVAGKDATDAAFAMV